MSIPMSISYGSVYSTLTLKCSSFPSQNPCCCISYTTPHLSVVSRPANSQYPSPIFKLNRSRIHTPPPSATAEAVSADPQTEASDSSASQDAPLEVKEVVVKPVGKQIVKPRLVLKFIWMEKNIGLGLDQLLPGHGAVPLSPYFFWPRKDAWEELRAVLESKPSISQKKMIILLNQATDIINLWQQSGGNLS